MRLDVSDIAVRSKELVRDLHRVRYPIYWADMLASVCVGWILFALALTLPPLPAAGLAMIAALALYRSLCFIHEISHQSHNLPGFEAVWNLTTGFPLLLPSCMYSGVHGDHHSLRTYGTGQDPEYLPFARSAGMTAAFIAQSLLLPLMLLVRFLVLAPVAIFVPPLERWLAVHFSSLTMNVRYCREVSPEILRMIRWQTYGILLLWLALAIVMPVKVFVLWYAISAFISLINTLRALGAHAYQSDGRPLNREEQLLDSIDTPAVWWGVFWAPVGLRFHGLHHYFPGIPYHNLGEAYRRLTAELPEGAGIHHVRSRSLVHSLAILFRNGLQDQVRQRPGT